MPDEMALFVLVVFGVATFSEPNAPGYWGADSAVEVIVGGHCADSAGRCWQWLLQGSSGLGEAMLFGGGCRYGLVCVDLLVGSCN